MKISIVVQQIIPLLEEQKEQGCKTTANWKTKRFTFNTDFKAEHILKEVEAFVNFYKKGD